MVEVIGDERREEAIEGSTTRVQRLLPSHAEVRLVWGGVACSTGWIEVCSLAALEKFEQDPLWISSGHWAMATHANLSFFPWLGIQLLARRSTW